jgi:hypothetical protein
MWPRASEIKAYSTGNSNHYDNAKMAKLKLSSSSPNIFILSDSTESNPYKNQNERSRCTVCLIVIFTFAIGLMMGHLSSAASHAED